MSHSHSFSWRPRKFRAFVTNQYYANRDEYDFHGQVQPHSFEEYVQQNLTELKQQYRQTFKYSGGKHNGKSNQMDSV